jgi:hypothetical protein
LNDHNDLAKYQIRGKAGEWDRMSLQCLPRGRYWENLIGQCLEPDYKKRLQNAASALRLVPDFGEYQSEVVSYNSVKAAAPVEEQSAKGFRLKILQGMEYGKTYDLVDIFDRSSRRLLTFGRGTANDVQLKEYQ